MHMVFLELKGVCYCTWQAPALVLSFFTVKRGAPFASSSRLPQASAAGVRGGDLRGRLERRAQQRRRAVPRGRAAAGAGGPARRGSAHRRCGETKDACYLKAHGTAAVRSRALLVLRLGGCIAFRAQLSCGHFASCLLSVRAVLIRWPWPSSSTRR